MDLNCKENMHIQQQQSGASIEIGNWKLDSVDNYDNYLKKLQYNALLRVAIMKLKLELSIDVSSDGQHWKIVSKTGSGIFGSMHTHTTEFDVGKEFDEKTQDGRDVRSICEYVIGVDVSIQSIEI